MKDSALLSAYRLASAGVGLTGPLYLYWRGKLGRDDFSRRHERLGRPYLARPDGRLALLHAESAAQAQALPPLVEKLGQLGFTVLLAIGDVSSGPFRAPRLPPSLHQLAPLDAPQFMARFLDHWRPDIVLISGPEIPPNLILEASRRKISLALVDARLPARRFLIWRKFPGFAGSLLRLVDLCLAQTNADAQRFAKLGMRKVQVTGNLKYDFVPAPVDQSALARLLARIGTRPAWVADRVYPGEEEIAMAAHRRLARQFPDLLTVIVPDNPKRVFEIAQSAAKLGLTLARKLTYGNSVAIPAIAKTKNMRRYRKDSWLTRQSVANRSHPVTPCFPLLSSEKQANFPSRGLTSVNIFSSSADFSVGYGLFPPPQDLRSFLHGTGIFF